MGIFAIGDLHLSFNPKVNKPMDEFGGEWVNHTNKLELNWKNTITKNDTVIIAGDISWGLKLEEAMDDLKWIANLPGHKVLIKGNHDLWWNSITKLNLLFENMTFLQNTCYETEGYCICGSRGWTCPGSDDYTLSDEKIYRREIERIKRSLLAAENKKSNKIIGVTHFPPTNDKCQNSEITKLFAKAQAQYAIYGHLHGDDAYKNGISGNFNGVNYKLVSLDYLKCKPFQIV